MDAPFAPSLFVDICKCIGQSVFERFHQAVIDVQDGEHDKQQAQPERQEMLAANNKRAQETVQPRLQGMVT